MLPGFPAFELVEFLGDFTPATVAVRVFQVAHARDEHFLRHWARGLLFTTLIAAVQYKQSSRLRRHPSRRTPDKCPTDDLHPEKAAAKRAPFTR